MHEEADMGPVDIIFNYSPSEYNNYVMQRYTERCVHFIGSMCLMIPLHLKFCPFIPCHHLLPHSKPMIPYQRMWE